jgi:hypothetical protein
MYEVGRQAGRHGSNNQEVTHRRVDGQEELGQCRMQISRIPSTKVALLYVVSLAVHICRK